MVHSPGFLKLVDEARSRVKEVTIDQARARLTNNPKAVLIDVREDHEWQTGHAAQKMGYHNVHSLIGGYKALVEANWPMKKES